MRYKLGQVVGDYVVVEIIPGFRSRGYRRILATRDGLPALITRRCDCDDAPEVVDVIDLVTDTPYAICSACRHGRE